MTRITWICRRMGCEKGGDRAMKRVLYFVVSVSGVLFMLAGCTPTW